MKTVVWKKGLFEKKKKKGHSTPRNLKSEQQRMGKKWDVRVWGVGERKKGKKKAAQAKKVGRRGA